MADTFLKFFAIIRTSAQSFFIWSRIQRHKLSLNMVGGAIRYSFLEFGIPSIAMGGGLGKGPSLMMRQFNVHTAY
jgi:hypothetical protein